MKLSRFQFDSVSVTQMVAAAILLPINIWLIFTGITRMQYYQNYTAALKNYNAKQVTSALKHARYAKENRPLSLAPHMLSAIIEVEEGDYAKAKGIYQELKDYTLVLDPQLGYLVCELEELQDKSLDAYEYDRLEREIEGTLSEDPDFLDASILLAHFHLKKYLDWRDQEEKQQQAQQSFSQAKRQFHKILQRLEEERDFLSAPTKHSLYSLYLGLAITSYWEGRALQKDLRMREESLEKISHAVDHLNSAFLYRIKNKELLAALQRIQGELLGYDWLSPQKRKALLQKAQQYLEQIKDYKGHLIMTSQNRLLDTWQLGKKNEPRQLYAGMGVSHYLLGDNQEAERRFSEALRFQGFPINENTVRQNLEQLALDEALERYLEDKERDHDRARRRLQRHFQAHYQDKWPNLEALEQYLKDNPKLSFGKFSEVANFLSLHYFFSEQPPFRVLRLLQTLVNNAPDHKYYSKEVGRFVHCKEALRHNFYYLAQRIVPDKAQKWAHYDLQSQEEK